MLRRAAIAAFAAFVLAFALPLAGCLPVATSTPSPTAGATATPTGEPTAVPPTPWDQDPTITFGPTLPGSLEDTLSKYFAALPDTKLSSGADAFSEYRAKLYPLPEGANLDAVFGAYSQFVWRLAFGLMEDFGALDTRWKNDKAAFLQDLTAAGLQAVEVEGSFVLQPDYQAIYAQLSPVLSPLAQQYCLMMVIQEDNPPTSGFEVQYLNVPLSSLCNMLADWDALCDPMNGASYPILEPGAKYTGHYDAQEIRRRLRIYLLSDDTYANEPMFDASDVLTQPFRDALDYYLATSPDASTAQIIRDYKKALEAQGWKRNAEATAVLTANDLPYMSSLSGGG